MKNIAIIGAMGSIGSQAIEIIKNHRDLFNLKAIVCHENIANLHDLLLDLKPEFCGIVDKECFKLFDKKLHKGIFFASGENSIKIACKMLGVDIVLICTNGICGLDAAVWAISAKKTIALATKEVLVGAGKMICNLARKKNVSILPVDSEHSAIFQCLQGAKPNLPSKVILTASGGAFRDLTREEMQNATVMQALQHPNWSMGKKITIDCATMTNKGLECIEAKHLFSLKPEQIQCILHRESIIHSMVEFQDKSVLCQMAYPSMEIPIQYALGYPNRYDSQQKSLDFAQIGKLSFEEIDREKYPCFALCEEVLQTDDYSALVLDVANEILVNQCLLGKEKLQNIAPKIRQALEHVPTENIDSLDNIKDIIKRTKCYLS